MLKERWSMGCQVLSLLEAQNFASEDSLKAYVFIVIHVSKTSP